MKVAAHPMLVAVALGLLGPNALAAEPAEDGRSSRGSASSQAQAGADDSKAELDDEAVMSALEDETGPYWTRLDLVGDEADSWREDGDLTVE